MKLALFILQLLLLHGVFLLQLTRLLLVSLLYLRLPRISPPLRHPLVLLLLLLLELPSLLFLPRLELFLLLLMALRSSPVARSTSKTPNCTFCDFGVFIDRISIYHHRLVTTSREDALTTGLFGTDYNRMKNPNAGKLAAMELPATLTQHQRHATTSGADGSCLLRSLER
jgi:hypothetical protein